MGFPWFLLFFRSSLIPGSWDPWGHLLEGLHGGDRSGSSTGAQLQAEEPSRGVDFLFLVKKTPGGVLVTVSWLVSW